MSGNPYQAPSSVNEDEVGSQLLDANLSLEFEADWSTAGFRLRRQRPWHRLTDFAMFFVIAVWLLALFGGIFLGFRSFNFGCATLPLLCSLVILWVGNLSRRHGGEFRRKCGGLAGHVQGRIDGVWLSFAGPHINYAARIRDPSKLLRGRVGSDLTLPGIPSALPLLNSDLRSADTASDEPIEEIEPPALLRRLPDWDQDAIVAEGRLRGKDLRRLNVHWYWCAFGISLTVIGLGLAGMAACRYSLLPHWVKNPPAHYGLSYEERSAVSGVAWWGIIGAVCLLIAAVYLFKLFRSYGNYAVAVSDSQVSISNDKYAMSHHGESLGHFRWIEQGLVVVDRNNFTKFLLPRRWFTEAEQQQIAEWYSREVTGLEHDYYLGPNV